MKTNIVTVVENGETWQCWTEWHWQWCFCLPSYYRFWYDGPFWTYGFVFGKLHVYYNSNYRERKPIKGHGY